MCEVGDIILVRDYQSQSNEISQHSFVVLSTDDGRISGMEYDLICNVVSSFKNEEQKIKN